MNWIFRKYKSSARKPVTFTFESPLLQAIDDRITEESAQIGRKVSRETFIRTYALKDAGVRKRYNKLTKEDTRYGDGK